MRNKKYIALLILIASIAASLFYSNSPLQPKTSTSVDQQSQAELISITQTIITKSDEEGTTINSKVNKESSALQALTSADNLEVEVKQYDFGSLVESINGIANGTDNKYWIFSINGKEADVGAGDYIVSEGDNIVWEFKAYED